MSNLKRIALLSFLALLLLPAAGAGTSAPARGGLVEVVVTLDSPPVARGGHVRTLAAVQGSVESRARGHGAPGRGPAPLLVRPRRPRREGSLERARPGEGHARSDRRLSERHLPLAALGHARLHRRAGGLGANAEDGGPGREDRDHRRRRQPDAPVLQPQGLQDAARVPEGAEALHDEEGDRRARVRPAVAEVEVRQPPVRSAELRARHPRRRHRRGQLPHQGVRARACPASRRRRSSATTRC